MSNRRITCLTIIVLCLLSHAVAQNWENLARQKSKLLNDLITQAQRKGIPVEREQMTLHTAGLFLKYADWDQAHPAENQKYFSYVPPFRKDAEKLSMELPSIERRGACDIIDKAIENLQAVLAGTVVRTDAPKVDFTKVKLHEGVLWQGDRPVFLADYTWKPESPELMKYYGALGGAYIDASHVENSSGRIRPWVADRLKNETSENIGFVFLGHLGIPRWALDKYDNLTLGKRHFTKYDIDHPGTRQLLSLLFKGTVPQAKDRRVSHLGYMLANEPHWFTAEKSWDTGPVSGYTKDKFKIWLQQRHQSIDTLNKLWNSRYKDFDAITIDIPISDSLQGKPLWYDWMTFNNHRVTEWFGFLKAEIQKYDPDALVHIKVMPELWSGSQKDHGFDFENLLRLQGIIGCDAKASYSHFYKKTQPWMDRYAFDWRHLCMPYDFFKSVQPHHLIFDTETHFLSTVHFRELDLSPAYARATYWLAHLHGLNASQTWVWGRDPSGAIAGRMKAGYAGSVAQQPKIVNEVALTLMDLNAFSREITAIQQQKKPVRIYYSLTSAINDKTYMDTIYDIYQSLYFEGLPLGFATDRIIRNQPHSDWEVILVGKTQRVTASELDALQAYLDRGGTVLIDDTSFKLDEYGRTHRTRLTPGRGKLVKISPQAAMKKNALDHLDSKGLLPEVSLNETNETGLQGCLWRTIDKAKGRHIVTIVNIGKSRATLQLGLKSAPHGISCTNLFTGQPIPRTIQLKPFDVMLIEIKKQ